MRPDHMKQNYIVIYDFKPIRKWPS